MKREIFIHGLQTRIKNEVYQINPFLAQESNFALAQNLAQDLVVEKENELKEEREKEKIKEEV